MNLQNLGLTDEEILRFVFKRGETRYTDLRNYLERNGVCNEKTFVSHKKQLEAAGLLRKKLSEKTYRPVYVIPTKVKRRLNLYFEREKTKRRVAQWVNSATRHELELAMQALQLLNDPKVRDFLELATPVFDKEVMDLLYTYCKKHHKQPKEVFKAAIREHIEKFT